MRFALLPMIRVLSHPVVLLAAAAPVIAQSAAQPWQRPGTGVGEEIIGPDGGAMVWVPAGEFLMGSEGGHSDELPVHRVRITRGFWLSKFEVTNAQYARFCRATGHPFPARSNRGPAHPVVWLTWAAAQAYCRHFGLRLPTEAEWEYAARGPQGRTYPWGNDWDARLCCNLGNDGPGTGTHPVGSFPEGASWCGALGLAGNAWEWCADWYGEDYYSHSPVEAPRGPRSGELRCSRGGSWYYNPIYCRSANRGRFDPHCGGESDGFRPALTPATTANGE